MPLKFKPLDKWNCNCGKEHKISISKILIKKDAVEDLPEIAKELFNGKKCLLVEDENTKKIAGDKIEKLLKENNYIVDYILVKKSSMENINYVATLLKNYDFSIAIGGGTPIDIAKMATYMNSLEFISFPTSPSHDGIASPIVSLIEKNEKKSLITHTPIAVVVDEEIISNAPKRMIASGVGDILSKIVSLKDWELGRDEKNEYYCNKAAELAYSAIEDTIDFIENNGKNIRLFIEALINAGVSMLIANSSRPCSGSEHLFSHYLDLNSSKPAMHGEQCGLGAIVMAKYHEENNLNWWKEKKYNWQNIKKLLNLINAPISIKKIGIEEEIAINALIYAPDLRPERYTILHKKRLDYISAKNLLYQTIM
ncbi:MAG: iron-containing alcohol dehydrogenase [Nitrososphaerota archaeon]